MVCHSIINHCCCHCYSVTVVSDSLLPHELQHNNLPCASLSPWVCSSSCPLSQLFNPTITSSVTFFSSCLQSFPESGSFPMNQHFASVAQSIGASAWVPVLQMNIQDWFFFRIDQFDLLDVQGTLKYLLQHYSSKEYIFQCSAFFMVQLLHPYITTGKTVDLTIQIFVGKVMSLLFNILSRFLITFLLRSKCLLNSYLQSPSSVILEPKKMKSITVSTLFPLICCEVMGPDSRILVFWMLSFKPVSFSTFIKRCLVPLNFLPLMLYHLHIWGCWYFSCQYWFHLMLHPAWHFAWCTLHIS